MYSIYIHIPYCRKRCTYCDFHFSTNMKHKADFVNALKKEITLRADEFNQGKILKSIYFGGGTPSILTWEEWESIFESLLPYIPKNKTSIEITAEVNPEDMTKDNINFWRDIGINRLSIGIQSFTDNTLSWMNRGHTSDTALNAITQAQTSGFDNINVDYILGTPHSDKELLIKDIQTLSRLNIQHISAYNLTVEKKTALIHQIEKEIITPLPDELVVEQFITMHNECNKIGLEHYEISNYALPGYQSIHNSAYWEGQTYIGLGPSSHSFNNKKRYCNISNNLHYIKSLTQGKLPMTVEDLTAANEYNEYIMLGIRSLKGISLHRLTQNWGEKVTNQFLSNINTFVKREWIEERDNHFYATLQGWVFSDHIASSLFINNKDLS